MGDQDTAWPEVTSAEWTRWEGLCAVFHLRRPGGRWTRCKNSPAKAGADEPGLCRYHAERRDLWRLPDGMLVLDEHGRAASTRRLDGAVPYASRHVRATMCEVWVPDYDNAESLFPGLLAFRPCTGSPVGDSRCASHPLGVEVQEVHPGVVAVAKERILGPRWGFWTAGFGTARVSGDGRWFSRCAGDLRVVVTDGSAVLVRDAPVGVAVDGAGAVARLCREAPGVFEARDLEEAVEVLGARGYRELPDAGPSAWVGT